MNSDGAVLQGMTPLKSRQNPGHECAHFTSPSFRYQYYYLLNQAIFAQFSIRETLYSEFLQVFTLINIHPQE